ncbi:hypothetical protein H7I94_11370, partial [Mycobacterium szulgai]|nr:hypothetical protein [Mycobacterium szulgai]
RQHEHRLSARLGPQVVDGQPGMGLVMTQRVQASNKLSRAPPLVLLVLIAARWG